MRTSAAVAQRPTRLRIEKNARQKLDGHALLSSLVYRTASIVHLDPQYRSVLDKLAYGNEGKSREKARAALPQMSESAIARFVEESQRVLKPGGHLLLWVDKFMIAEGRHIGLFARAPELVRVEMIHWNKMRPGMGRRARCRSEYLIIAQKKPARADIYWQDRRIDDSWPESTDRGIHPHAKPTQLLQRLVRTLTKKGDLVVDPCAGGYGMLEICRLTGREFIGCDLTTELEKGENQDASTHEGRPAPRPVAPRQSPRARRIARRLAAARVAGRRDELPDQSRRP